MSKTITMNCKTIHKQLIFFVEKDLPISEMKAIQGHLDSCKECALFAEELQKTLGVIETEKVNEINPFFYTRVKSRLENRENSTSLARPLVVRILQPVAFSIVLILSVYGGIKLGQPHKAEMASIVLNEQQMVPYVNEMDAEPIEAFLME